MTFNSLLATLQSFIDFHSIPDTGPISDKLEEAVSKTQDALSKFAGDPSAAASDLSGARGEIDSAESEGLPSADANLLRQMIDDLITVINSGGDPINGGGSPLCDNGITHTRPGGAGVPTAADCANIFVFNYDKWYEGREQRYVDIIDIDVDQLYTWLDAQIESVEVLYITMDGTNPAQDPSGDGTYPVIRLINAQASRPHHLCHESPDIRAGPLQQ